MAGIGANEPFTSLIKNGSICPIPLKKSVFE
jgi:hypothetical protein